MGRLDLRNVRVHQAATQMMKNNRIRELPPWHDIIGTVPPSQILVRPLQPQLQTKKLKGGRKPSKMFQPAPIVYPEDNLRKEFFGDHPWELARPRVVLEDDGKNGRDWDWSKIVQPGKRLDGESVVQRQLWLMQNKKMSREAAYDMARKEFYHYRHLEDVERRIAKEEALSTGAYFGKTAIQVGMELEDAAWENWKAWATKEIEVQRLNRVSAYSGPVEDDAQTPLEDGAELEAAIEEEAPAIPKADRGQKALGGAAFHP